MAIIQKDIVVPDNLLPGIMNGTIDIMGLAKNADNGRVVKHLNTIDSYSSKSAATKLVIGFTVFAGISYCIYTFANKSKARRFNEALNSYIKAVNNKDLTVEIIDDLVNALDNIKGKQRKNIQIQFSSGELTALIECLCNHTQTLADANNYNLSSEPTEEEKNDMLMKLRNNLVKQRDIFEFAA